MEKLEQAEMAVVTAMHEYGALVKQVDDYVAEKTQEAEMVQTMCADFKKQADALKIEVGSLTAEKDGVSAQIRGLHDEYKQKRAVEEAENAKARRDMEAETEKFEQSLADRREAMRKACDQAGKDADAAQKKLDGVKRQMEAVAASLTKQ